MSRTADVSVLAATSKKLVELVAPQMERDDAEALELDLDSIGVLMVEFQGTQLAHDEVQWVFWHLLEHVLSDLQDVLEAVTDDDAADALYDAMDDYVEAFQERLESRAKITNARLDALLSTYWAEAEDQDDGGDDDPEPAGEEEPATGDAESDPAADEE